MAMELNTFQTADKVRVLKNNNVEKSEWQTYYRGIITKLGTKGFVKIMDPIKTDSNTGLFGESEEWIAIDSKMMRVIKE